MRTGNASRAEHLLQALGNGEAYGSPIGFAWFYMVSSEIEKAAAWIEKAIPSRHAEIIFDNLYLSFFNNGRQWPALARQLNLPESGGEPL